MTTRTDIHRPSAITPENYEFVGCDYYGPTYGDQVDRKFIHQHMARTGGKYSNHDHGGTCHVCGAAALYVAVYHHADTNTYIVTGEDCASKMDAGEAIAFRSLRKRIAAGRKADKGIKKAKEVLAAADALALWDIYSAPYVDKYEESTIRDIVSKLVKYGSVSDKALGFARSLVEKIANRAQIEAERAKALEAALPVPVTDARILIKGTVLSTKVVDGPYGRQTKVLVQHADGWKVWGSDPVGSDKGDVIEFYAKVQVSDKDAKFGFFSRPTKARLVSSKLVDDILAPDTTWGVIIGHKEGLPGTISGKTAEQAKITFDQACELATAGHIDYVLLTHNGNTVDSWGT